MGFPKLSSDWLQFWPLDTSYSWLHPTSDSSSGDWIRATADSILFLARVPVTGCDLSLILDCDSLWDVADASSSASIQVRADSNLRLTTSCCWFYPEADSSSCSWTWLATDLYFDTSSKFKDSFCKIHHFYGLVSTGWFQLPLIQALATASRTVKKVE